MEDTSVEAGIRAELMEVVDRLRMLPGDAFAERTALCDRQSQLRSLLAQFEGSEGRATRARRAEEAARRSGVPDPVVPSPGEGGGDVSV